MTHITRSIKVLAYLLVAFSLSIGMQYLYAWTGPSANPPSANVEPPVNVGSTDQVKLGALGVGSLAVYGESAFLGNIDLGGFEILNVAEPTTNTSAATKQYVDTLAAAGGGSGGSGDGGGDDGEVVRGGDSVMYLRSKDTPASCPAGWNQADYTEELASGYDSSHMYMNNVRTCYEETASCQVMYLRGIVFGNGTYYVGNCPSGWTQADDQFEHVLASPSVGALMNRVKTCYVCH